MEPTSANMPKSWNPMEPSYFDSLRDMPMGDEQTEQEQAERELSERIMSMLYDVMGPEIFE